MAIEEPIETEERFYEQLREVVNGAIANGIDIEGAWPVLNDDPDIPDWDIEIVALAKSDQ